MIATLRPAVDAFFDKVMVLDPDPKLRGAHLGLIDEVLRSSPPSPTSARS
jgi:glycyl-tRNA synthetase beta chain